MEFIQIKGGLLLRAKLGWISIGLMVLTFLVLFTFPINGFWGDAILIGGLVLALLAAIFSNRGIGKILAFILMIVLLILFVLSVLNFLGIFT